MKLVPNARSAWKWFSVQCMGFALTVQTAWISIPDDLKASVPDVYLSIGTGALLALGIVGRLVDQGTAE